MARQRVAEAGCAIAYVNQVGGQDELVFDGGSFVMDRAGVVLAVAPTVRRDRSHRRCRRSRRRSPGRTATPAGGVCRWCRCSAAPRDPDVRPAPPRRRRSLAEEAEVYDALVLGTRDYLAQERLHRRRDRAVRRCRLGSGRHRRGGRPRRRARARLWPCRRATRARVRSPTPPRWPSASASTLQTVPIEDAHAASSALLAPVVGDAPTGLTDENLPVAASVVCCSWRCPTPGVDRPHHRQQERARHRLLDALRRLRPVASP